MKNFTKEMVDEMNYLKDYGITAYNYEYVNSEELWFNINAYVRVQS